MDFIFVIIGLILLFAGGEGLVRGSVVISKRLGISAILIGVVVVGFGTSAPELLVSIKASLNDQPDIALGNVVGSNIANVLLIMGVASLLNPIRCKDKAIVRDAFAVVISSVVLLGLAYWGIIPRIAGGIMFLTLIGYLVYSYKAETGDKQHPSGNERPDTKNAGNAEQDEGTVHEHEAAEFDDTLGLTTSIFLSIVGIAMLVFGADLLVRGASNLARAAGISEAVIGLSLVALGTSLPELATAITASLRKHSDVVIGNVLGSNLFNVLNILGITALIQPIPISNQIASFDIPFTLGLSVVMLAVIIGLKVFGRLNGLVFLLAYGAYIGWLYLDGTIAL